MSEHIFYVVGTSEDDDDDDEDDDMATLAPFPEILAVATKQAETKMLIDQRKQASTWHEIVRTAVPVLTGKRYY